jgi:hypothetical protein
MVICGTSPASKTRVTSAAGIAKILTIHTGTLPYDIVGGTALGGAGPFGPLGCDCGVDWGNSNTTSSGWAGADGAGIGETTPRSFYAMSGLLKVADVPLPAVAPLLVGLGALGLTARRKARPARA